MPRRRHRRRCSRAGISRCGIPPTLSQALDVVAGVSAISEGQAAVPAIRGLARGRTLILVDGSRATTERRAGSNASFLDPGAIRTIEVARGPGSVAYGSDAFGGVIAVRTRGPDYGESWQARFAGTAGWGAPERRGEVEVSKGYESGGVLVGVRAREFDDYDAPAGAVTNSGWRDGGVRARWEHTTAQDLWSVGWQSDFGRDLGRPRSDSDVMLATSPLEDSHRLTASYERRVAPADGAIFESTRSPAGRGSAPSRNGWPRPRGRETSNARTCHPASRRCGSPPSASSASRECTSAARSSGVPGSRRSIPT